MTSANRAAFDAAIDNWNRGDLDRYLDLYDASIQLHGYSEAPMQLASVRDFYLGVRAALSDSIIDVLDVVETDARLAVRATLSGTHTGEMAGVAPTGRRVVQPVMTFLRFANARCVERWSIADFPAVMAQITAA